MQKTFRSHTKSGKWKASEWASGGGGEKVKLLTGNFQSEMNYFEVSWQGVGSYRSVKFKKPWNNINLLQIRLPSFLSWINLISLSPVQSWDSISMLSGSARQDSHWQWK